MAPRSGPDWGHISAIFGIVASLGGIAGFMFSPDTQRCVGLRGTYRGNPLRALRHCTDDRSIATNASPIAVLPAPQSPPVEADNDPRRLAGTRWVFYAGDAKTYLTFEPGGTLTFSDPAYGSGGVWELAGTRGVAFHTDTYEFGGTIGRGVPDSFEVKYKRLGGTEGAEEQTMTLTRVAS